MPVSVRKLIIENKIPQAFQFLEPLVSGQDKNDLHLLWAQFSYWEKQDASGLKPSLAERNRILYSVLQIISDLEGNSILQQMEVNLVKDYEQLDALSKQGNIDKIMLWLLEKHPEKFNERLGYELHMSGSSLNVTFNNAILKAYINETNLDVSAEYLFKYISDKYDSIPNFFNEWSAYSQKRIAAVKSIQHKIRYNEKRYYKKLLITGLLGGISGGALMAFFSDNIELDLDDDDDDDD